MCVGACFFPLSLAPRTRGLIALLNWQDLSATTREAVSQITGLPTRSFIAQTPMRNRCDACEGNPAALQRKP